VTIKLTRSDFPLRRNVHIEVFDHFEQHQLACRRLRCQMGRLEWHDGSSLKTIRTETKKVVVLRTGLPLTDIADGPEESACCVSWVAMAFTASLRFSSSRSHRF
jgi:hypothetical protein